MHGGLPLGWAVAGMAPGLALAPPVLATGEGLAPAAVAAASLAPAAAGWALAGAAPVALAAATAAQSCRRSSASQSCPAHPPWWLRKGMLERVQFDC